MIVSTLLHNNNDNDNSDEDLNMGRIFGAMANFKYGHQNENHGIHCEKKLIGKPGDFGHSGLVLQLFDMVNSGQSGMALQ